VLPIEPGGEVLNNQDKLIYKNFETTRNTNTSEKDKSQAEETHDKTAEVYEKAKPEEPKKPEIKKVKPSAVMKAEVKKPIEKKKVNSVFDVME
jgi:hypothetical protein